MILTVTLNAAVARTLVVPSLTLGQRHRATESIALAGGKGINVSRSLRELGVPVLATGFVGGRNGDAIRDGLSEAAIPFDFVETKSPSRTSTAIIDPTSGSQTEINDYGHEATPEETRELSRRFEFLLEYATAVVFSGSIPESPGGSFLTELLEMANRRELYTVVDSTPPLLKAALKSSPSLVSPNQSEAESTVGFDFIEAEDFARGLGRLNEMGAKEACITSSEGLSYLSFGEVISVRGPQVEGISTIGSGDAYLAGLLAGTLYRGLSIFEAGRLAAGCAAANAEMLGAGIFDVERALELAEEARVENYAGSPG